MASTRRQPFVLGFWGVRYLVKDVQRSVAFYTQVLGFELDQQHPPAFGQVSIGDLKLILSGPGASGSRPMPDGGPQEPGGWNRVVLEVKDLPARIRELETQGVRLRNEMEVPAMARTILVVHGAGEPRRRRGKVYWEPLLGDALGPGYLVKAPRMPRPDAPVYRPWARRIAGLIAGTGKPILVGHSFGASVLLKYLSEAIRRPVLAGLFLIATPFWGPDFPEFALWPDFGERLRDLSPIYLYHSRDDPEVPFEHLERYSRVLSHAIVRVFDGRGHEFNQPEFPELAADIRGLAPQRRAV
jgi:glyoxylase I family protein